MTAKSTNQFVVDVIENGDTLIFYKFPDHIPRVGEQFCMEIDPEVDDEIDYADDNWVIGIVKDVSWRYTIDEHYTVALRISLKENTEEEEIENVG